MSLSPALSTLTLELDEPFRIVVENDLGTITPYILLEQETWFEAEVPFFHAFLQPGMRVVDIGTNCGFYTLLAAHRVGNAGHVWGFEPGSKPARMLRQSLILNDYANVTLYEAAVGAEPGSVWFFDKVFSELSAVVAADTPGAREVKLESLDRLYAEGEMHGVDFIKIDAEGFEDQVIKGGAHFFTSENPLIMLEITASQVNDMGPAGLLQAYGYQTYRYYPATECLAPLTIDKPGDYILNIFLCKPAREAALRDAGLLVTRAQLAYPYPDADPALFAAYFAALPIVASCPELTALLAQPVSYETIGFHTMCAEFLLSADPVLDVAERTARLGRAEHWIDSHFIDDIPFAQALSFLPVWAACGRIALVAGMLRILISGESGIEATIDQPFLPAAVKWQALAAWDGNLAIWLNCMMAEQYELFRAYSSFYDNAGTYEAYELLRDAGYLNERLERRAGLSALVIDSQGFKPIFIDKASRNQTIWNEIATRLAQGEHFVKQLHAGQNLPLTPAV